MFSGRYKQMFFPSNLKLKGNLNPNEYVDFHWFPVFTYASKILQSVTPGHIDGGRCPTFHSK
jgi:hypothetical protein